MTGHAVNMKKAQYKFYNNIIAWIIEIWVGNYFGLDYRKSKQITFNIIHGYCLLLDVDDLFPARPF